MNANEDALLKARAKRMNATYKYFLMRNVAIPGWFQRLT